MSPIAVQVLLQVVDGIFTYAGVTTLGLGNEAEGNPIVRSLMYALGPGKALMLVKGLSIAAVLYANAKVAQRVMLETLIIRVNWLYMLSAAMWAYVFLR